MTVITSVVAENTYRVTDYQDIRSDIIVKQIDDVFMDIPPDAVKIGMLSCKETMLAVAEKIREWKPKNVVVDPVMYAKNGCALMDPMAIDSLIAQVVPLADVVTPNIPEAQKMTSMEIKTHRDMRQAARLIYAMGCKAVVVKGGHGEGEAKDILYDGEDFLEFSSPRIETPHTHGTGCTLSSAIAANLALGNPVYKAVEMAKQYITTAIANAPKLGKGNGPLHHFYKMYKSYFGEV